MTHPRGEIVYCTTSSKVGTTRGWSFRRVPLLGGLEGEKEEDIKAMKEEAKDRARRRRKLTNPVHGPAQHLIINADDLTILTEDEETAGKQFEVLKRENLIREN